MLKKVLWLDSWYNIIWGGGVIGIHVQGCTGEGESWRGCTPKMAWTKSVLPTIAQLETSLIWYILATTVQLGYRLITAFKLNLN